MPRVVLTRRQIVLFAVFILSGIAFLYFVLPKLAGVGTTVHRIERGDTWWIAIGVVLELASFAGYIVLFRSVFVRARRTDRLARELRDHDGRPRRHAAVRRRRRRRRGADCVGAAALGHGAASCRLPDGGLHGAAVRGLRGLAADRWDRARRRRCSPAAARSRSRSSRRSWPRCCSLLAGAMALLPGDLERRLNGGRRARGALAHWMARAATAPALAASGIRTAIDLIRQRDAGLLGALAWWGFDISVLWAMFHAFGSPPPFTVIWMAYFVGMLGNLLPLPGGLGGVEGGHDRRVRRLRRRLQPVGARGALLSRDLLLAADAPRWRRLLPAAPYRRPLARTGASGPLRYARVGSSEPAGALQSVLTYPETQPQC